MNTHISNQPVQVSIWPADFPLCAYANSSDPALQYRCGPRVTDQQQLQFLERFVDGAWIGVTQAEETLIDGALLAGGWRFDYNPAYPIVEYRLIYWQRLLVRRLRNSLVKVGL